jgi:acyl-coenzyme A synthetase/AMP-(fatty) acid ligase
MKMFDGYYFTADGGYKDEDGYVFVMGRVDDVINVAGHRLSTGEMEEIAVKASNAWGWNIVAWI